MIAQKSIERLLDITDIVDVISHYVEVRKMGANYKCVCPFHDDKNPSMSISPQKQIYHCFACKAGGNAIKFIMDYERLNYPEAIEKLAALNNFTLEYTASKSSFKGDKYILQKVNTFYRSRLYQNKDAINYLYSRGINDDMIERFELGFAPDNNLTLRLLQNEQIEQKDALEVGIVKQNERGIYASFVERITFPIHSTTGHLVGFGGRTITNHPAKYVNSPQSSVFDKSKLFYGYHIAKQNIYQKKQIIITEGYLDVIMLHSVGFTNAVAVLGTALTEKHIPILRREDISVILCFDGDSAGINAAIKSSHMLAIHDIDGSVVIIEDGSDPADMVFAGKIDRLKQLFSSGVEIGEFYIRQIALKYDISRPVYRQKCLDEITAFIKSLKPIVGSSYTELVASIIGVSPSSLNLNKPSLNKSLKIANNDAFESTSKPSKNLLEFSLLKTMVFNPKFKSLILSELISKHFLNHSEIFNAILKGEDENESPLLRELKLDDSAMAIDNEKELLNGIRNLKIKFYENMQKDISRSNVDDRIDILEKISKILKGLKEQI